MVIFQKNKIFVIAEMANSHEGNFELAKQITKSAANSGANAIKFQKFSANELAEPSHENYKLYQKLEMSKNQWKNLVQYAKKLKLKVFMDVFGVNSAKSALELKVDGIKIHSADISNPHLLKFLSNKKIPILLSTAGCLLNEIDEAIKLLNYVPKELALMHGFQGYPTKPVDINLNKFKKIREKYELPIGIMDHISGSSDLASIVPLLGISIGAIIVEKHLTLDRSKKGLDYYSALNPDEFQQMVLLIKKTQQTLGEKTFSLSKNELSYRLMHKKNPISRRIIPKGKVLRESDFDFKRTKTKKSISLYEFIDKKSSKKIPKNTPLDTSMIDKKSFRVAAVIACRVHSTRLFAKQMQLIDNRPIIDHLITQLKSSKLISEFILAISSKSGNEVFIDYARKNKIKYVIGDDTDVLKRLIDGAKYVNADIIFRITPENPFVFWEGIDETIKTHISGNYDFTTCYNVPLGTGFEVVNLKAFEISHKNGSKRHRSELCSLYINENKKKFKIHHFLPKNEFQRPEIRLTVDTPEDLYVTRAIFDTLGNKKKLIPLKKIIQFMDKNPSIGKMNSQVPLDVSRIWIENDPLRKSIS